MQVITEILDGKTFHQCASRIDEFYRLKFGDTCITRKNIRFISYIIKPSTNVAHGERMNPIDFQGQGNYRLLPNILVIKIESRAFVRESSNLPHDFQDRR